MIFLAHHAQLGISLPEPKVRAIMSGDISGSIVDPVLIYIAQLMGCRLWQEQRHITTYNPIEMMQCEAVLQILETTQNPIARLQVHCQLAIYFLLKREMREGREQLLRAAQVITQYNLHFKPGYSVSVSETSDDVQERICALSQFVYLDKDASIVLNDPSLLSVELEDQFRALPVSVSVMLCALLRMTLYSRLYTPSFQGTWSSCVPGALRFFSWHAVYPPNGRTCFFTLQVPPHRCQLSRMSGTKSTGLL